MITGQSNISSVWSHIVTEAHIKKVRYGEALIRMETDWFKRLPEVRRLCFNYINSIAN